LAQKQIEDGGDQRLAVLQLQRFTGTRRISTSS
jgi:hypothetical protein